MKDYAHETQVLANKIADRDNTDEEMLELCREMLELLYEFRDNFENKIKNASANQKSILRLQVVELENQIEHYKQKMNTFARACEKETEMIEQHQQELDVLFDEADLQVAKMYIIAKHQMPKDFFDGLHKTIVDNLTQELVEEFEERIAYLEATQLEDILAGK